MPRPKRILFEQLTWEDEMLQGSGTATADEQATAALMALGNFQCITCHALLRQEKGYTCCHRAYCPCCGRCTIGWGKDVYDDCPHYVLSCTRQRWTQHLHTIFTQMRHQEEKNDDSVAKEWFALMTLIPPARRLAGQKVTGFPRWTGTQLSVAYTTDVLPHLQTLFGPDLRECTTTMLGHTLLKVLRPDMKTSLRDSHYHWEDNYFSAEPRQALARAEAFLKNVHAGTKRLRDMPPQTIVRPQRVGVS